ncbi:hypothetical protein MAPG_10884 [Magnaporthiopsis poae ATCC 64411]|uniref:Chromo domain-containing protein n=1 Tax=Magnaporthiopsis poae (strain ATCC 64411 / 73-15) TaxID=644358 RepID=A0A0C4EDS4_MAGP6|nr:hypothetical protein MAPG_10884 [Magnaporthiopsis poae ATCC 64411]
MAARQGALPSTSASAPDKARTATPEAPGGPLEPVVLAPKAASADPAIAPPEEQDYDDQVSVASSEDQEYGPDHMYEVEALHAEKVIRDGTKKYLIEWANYAFKDWSWEPAEEISDVLKEEWERTKHEIAAGLKPPQHEVIAQWRQAKAAEIERRENKNARRVRLGLDPISYPDFPESESEISDESDVGSPAAEAPSHPRSDSADDANPHALGKQKENRPHQSRRPAALRGQRRTSTGILGAKPKAAAPKRTASSSSMDSAVQGKAAVDAGVKSATGYQGTARPLGSGTGALSKPLAGQRSAAAAKNTASRTARKSAPIIRNVFIDGKKRKPRRKSSSEIPVNPLLEPSDPSASGGKFWNLSTKRKVQLRGRDLENASPSLSLQDVVFASHVDPAALRASALAEALALGNRGAAATEGYAPEPDVPEEAAAGSSTSGITEKWQAEEAAAGNSTSGTTEKWQAGEAAAGKSTSGTAEKRQAEEAAAPGATRTKKRKSVHFADCESPKAVSSTAMELDDPIAPSGDENPTADNDDDTIPMDLDSPAVAERAARFSTQDVTKKTVFGVASGTSLEVCFRGIPNERPWLPDFLAEESVHFSHTCLADTFLARQTMRWHGEPFWHGNLTSPAEHGEEALSNVAEQLKARASGIVFARPGYNILAYPSRMDDWAFPELEAEEGSAPSGEDSPLKYHVFISHVDISAFLNWDPQPLPSGLSDRQQIMDTVFGMDESLYSSLVAPKSEDAEVHKHLFYLLFPPSKAPYCFQLMLWLRECNPDAEIFVPMQDGSWNAFLELASRDQDLAVLIVHESAMLLLRQVPSLVSFLSHGRNHLVWLWPDKGRTSPALMPSIPELAGDEPRGPFDIQPIRLFPHNHVFLLTPSFYIAEPAQALDLVLSLPLSNHSASGARKLLMVPQDIVRFLDHVAAEHYQDRDTPARYELALAMLDMIGPRPAVIPDQSYATPLLFVDEEIDARDEQSLVNWFAAWSIAHADQYRRFHVVGTSSSSPPARCWMRMPRYLPDTTSDPDALRRAQQEEARRGMRAAPQSPPQSGPLVRAASPAAGSRLRPDKFQSRILEYDDFESLNQYLMKISRTRRPGPWRVYGYPVFYLDELYGDGHRLKSGSFEAWFSYTWSFSNTYKLYASFFYTVDDTWDPDGPSGGLYAPRQPWVAVLRSKRREHTELVIIDPAARHRLKGIARPVLTDLTTAQRKLVEFVSERSGEKSNRDFDYRAQRLDEVWVGDISHIEGSDFDMCLRFLELTIDDWDNVPLSDKKLLERGFKPVKGPGLETPPDSMLPDPVEEDEDSFSIAFHPPTAHKPPRGASLCRNDMVEVALGKTRRYGRSAGGTKFVKYKYRPTEEWYADQQAEGRDFTHVDVVTSLDAISRLSRSGRKPSESQRGDDSRPSSRG